MMKFTYKLKVTERITAKCNRHPRYSLRRRDAGASKADAPGALPSSICINLVSRWQQQGRGSSALLHLGHVPASPGYASSQLSLATLLPRKASGDTVGRVHPFKARRRLGASFSSLPPYVFTSLGKDG